jgi:hypothetical protein
MKMKIIIFIGKILINGGRINLVAPMSPIKMQRGDLFMIQRWPADFIRSRASIIKISAAISAFLLKNILNFNARASEALISEALISEAVKSKALISEALESEALESEALISEALKSEALTIEALRSNKITHRVV